MKDLYSKFNRFYGPSILSGFLLVFSFPQFDIYLLAWFALVPFLVFLYGKDRKTAFRAGLLFGIVYFYGTIYWIYHSIYKYGSISLLPSLLLVLLLCLYLSLYPALFAVLYSSYIKKTILPVMLIAPIFWTPLEFLRSYAFSGFPWSSLGYSQYKFLLFIQIADIVGVYGISFLLMAFNGALADIALLNVRHKERPLYPLIPVISSFIVIFLALLMTFSYGYWRLHQQREGAVIRAAVVQGNIEQDRKWDPSYQKAVLDVYRDLSSQAALLNPNLIVWPETAVPFYFGKDIELTNSLLDFQKQQNAYLLFGGVLDKNGNYTNSAVLLNKDGIVTYAYDKIHLVPFGEYVPLKKLLFFVNKLTVGVGDYIRGNSYIKATTPFGRFCTVICYEIIFPGLVRKFFVKGGDFIVTITNDAWFGKTNGPYQHFSMAVFRAIENRKPVIRAANSGISGFIDSNGRIFAHTKLFERTFLVNDIKTDSTLSLYTKYGDIFLYLCIVCFLFLFIKKY